MKDEAIETCSNGHPWTPANTRWESSGRGKHKRRRCRQCLRDKAARRVETFDYATSNGIPTEIRKARPDHVRVALAEFESAQEHVKAKCAGTGKGNPWTDGWEDENGELIPENIPSPQYAKELCKGCPLLLVCQRAGDMTLPGLGVWGGNVWVYGEIYTGGLKEYEN